MTTQSYDATSEIPCNLCGNLHVRIIAGKGRDGEALRTVICRQCGLVWSDPFPMDVTEYYQKNYRLSYKGAYTPKKKHIWRAANVALSRLNKIRPYLDGRTNMLDVGSGGGEFLYLMHTLGLSTQGIEPNEGYGEYSRQEYGLNVSIGFAQNHDFPPASFDLVTMWHVLEHTDDPVGVLQKLRVWLRENGMLVVEVPNVEATCQMPKSTFHAAHLFNFNHATLTGVASKAGFRTIVKLTSEDGGNITHFLQPATSVDDSEVTNMPDAANFERILSIRNAHTNLSHYLSAAPYQRLWHKLTRSQQEKNHANQFSRGKELLDARYATSSFLGQGD